MSDAQTLLLAMVAIYLSDCAGWGSAAAVSFSAGWRREFAWSLAGRWLGNNNGGLIVRFPWPPLGQWHLTQFCPCSLARDGIVSAVGGAAGRDSRPLSPEIALAWHQVRSVRVDGRKILLNDRPFTTADSTAAAVRLAGRIKRLSQLPANERPAAIEAALAAEFELDAIRARVDQFRAATVWLRLACNALFVGLFLAGPLLAWQAGLATSWWILLAGLLVLWGQVVIAFLRARRALAQSAGAGSQTLLLALNPLAATRALDLLGRDWLEAYHPVAVASVLCRAADYREFAGLVYRDLVFPRWPILADDDPAAIAIESEFREASRLALARHFADTCLSAAELLAPSQPVEAGCVSYCPRCLDQFTPAAGDCHRCGQALRPLADDQG